MNTDLQNLRQEHADRVIGPELEHLLARIVRATARAYPPAEYSDAGVWDSAALADALQDWVETRLLSRGDLSKMLLRYQSVGALRGALTRSFEQFLTNRRRRTSATNLYQRTTKMLREDSDSFAKLGRADRSHEQLWTLAAGPATEPSRLEAPALVAQELSEAWNGKFLINAEFNVLDSGQPDQNHMNEVRDQYAPDIPSSSFAQMGYLAGRAATEALLGIQGDVTKESVNEAFKNLTNFSSDIWCKPWYFASTLDANVSNNVDLTVAPQDGNMVQVEDCFEIAALPQNPLEAIRQKEVELGLNTG